MVRAADMNGRHMNRTPTQILPLASPYFAIAPSSGTRAVFVLQERAGLCRFHVFPVGVVAC